MNYGSCTDILFSIYSGLQLHYLWTFLLRLGMFSTLCKCSSERWLLFELREVWFFWTWSPMFSEARVSVWISLLRKVVFSSALVLNKGWLGGPLPDSIEEIESNSLQCSTSTLPAAYLSLPVSDKKLRRSDLLAWIEKITTNYQGGKLPCWALLSSSFGSFHHHHYPNLLISCPQGS